MSVFSTARVTAVACCVLVFIVGFAIAPTAEAKPKRPRVNPYAGCYQHANRAYNFGFLTLPKLDYSFGAPTVSPYTAIPACRVTTATPGDKPANRIEESASFAKTNARVGVFRLNPAALEPAHQAWPMYDSTGKVALWIVAVPQKFDRTEWRFYSRNWGGPGSSVGQLLATRFMTNDTAPMRVQGRACMTSRSMINTHYAVQFPNLRSSLAGIDRDTYGRPSVWGFLPITSFDFSDVDISFIAAINAGRKYDGVLVSCGRTHRLARHGRSVPFRLTQSTFNIPLHHYLGGTSWKRCNPDDPAAADSEEGQCGSYGQYFGVPGSLTRVVASSTTGIAGGGLPLALVPQTLRFRAIRFFNYCDLNVPRVEVQAESVLVPGTAADGVRQLAAWNRAGHAVWIFGKFWVGGRTRFVYGWTPESCARLPELRLAFATKR